MAKLVDHRTPRSTHVLRAPFYDFRARFSGFPPEYRPFCDSEFSAFSHGTSIIRHKYQNTPSIIRSIKNRHNPRFEKHPAEDPSQPGLSSVSPWETASQPSLPVFCLVFFETDLFHLISHNKKCPDWHMTLGCLLFLVL